MLNRFKLDTAEVSSTKPIQQQLSRCISVCITSPLTFIWSNFPKEWFKAVDNQACIEMQLSPHLSSLTQLSSAGMATQSYTLGVHCTERSWELNDDVFKKDRKRVDLRALWFLITRLSLHPRASMTKSISKISTEYSRRHPEYVEGSDYQETRNTEGKFRGTSNIQKIITQYQSKTPYCENTVPNNIWWWT